MKYYKNIAGLLAVLLFLATNVFAQEHEMTEEEWQGEINRLTEKKTDLTTELNGLKSDIDNLKSTEMGLQAYEDCMNELYAMVGATKADVDNFRMKLNDLEGKINAQESPKADRQAALDEMKMNKISALPEYFDKVHNQLQRKLDAWMEKPKEVMYTVVRGDCLWNIAKKKEHYANGFAWPMIYKANRDQIKDPDLIYPKQTFKVPNLTDQEKAKYDKIRRNYKPAPPMQGN